MGYAAGPGPTAPARSRKYRTRAVWAGVGFIAGAVCWHAIGFWDFMSKAVLAGDRDTELAAAARLQPNAGGLATIYLVDPRRCTALELDRTANRTAVRPCPSEGLALRLVPAHEREDFAALAP